MDINIENISNEFELSETEKQFIIASGNLESTDRNNQSRITSEIILGKRTEGSTNKIIRSNEKLSASNEKKI